MHQFVVNTGYTRHSFAYSFLYWNIVLTAGPHKKNSSSSAKNTVTTFKQIFLVVRIVIRNSACFQQSHILLVAPRSQTKKSKKLVSQPKDPESGSNSKKLLSDSKNLSVPVTWNQTKFLCLRTVIAGSR